MISLKMILSFPKILWINLRIFPLRTALKLPIWIHYKTKIASVDRGCIKIDEQNKQLNITYPEKLDNIDKTTRKQYIDKGIKQLLKNNTENLLLERVPYWSKITNIPYKEFKVNDATSKFGSCISKTKVLHFSSRLIILPQEKIDAVIVHELCHIIYPNHSQNFYNLVKKFIPNYDEINKWLKKNGGIILF